MFPFPIFFEHQLRTEWAKPAANLQSPTLVKKLYNLPDFTNKMLQVPLVDAPVLAIQLMGLLSEDGQGSIWDLWDKVIEIALRHSHEATALAIKACAMASIVARASIVWGGKMVELLPAKETRLLELGSRILKTSAFLADASLDGHLRL